MSTSLNEILRAELEAGFSILPASPHGMHFFPMQKRTSTRTWVSILDDRDLGHDYLPIPAILTLSSDFQVLIQNEADVNATGAGGFTPLHYAAREGEVLVAKVRLADAQLVTVSRPLSSCSCCWTTVRMWTALSTTDEPLCIWRSSRDSPSSSR